MTRQELIDYCLSFADAYEDYPFREPPKNSTSWAALRHQGNGKTFAFIYDRFGLCLNLKCEPRRADFLRNAFPEGVLPAFHMNKEHWNSVYPGKGLNDDAILDMIDHSYQLTMPKRSS
ncbi:MAG: MmcQ/YjbR family DNA-binding protein, partial [Oscillospiraceae bacterium]